MLIGVAAAETERGRALVAAAVALSLLPTIANQRDSGTAIVTETCLKETGETGTGNETEIMMLGEGGPTETTSLAVAGDGTATANASQPIPCRLGRQDDTEVDSRRACVFTAYSRVV